MTGQESSAEKRLEEVEREIKRWRGTRLKLGPMPEQLWAEAIGLAKELGAGPVSRKLDLNYGALSRRADPTKVRRPKERGKKTALSEFVEVTQGAPVATSPTPNTVIELMSASGNRLTVRLSQTVDVSVLLNQFQGRQ